MAGMHACMYARMGRNVTHKTKKTSSALDPVRGPKWMDYNQEINTIYTIAHFWTYVLSDALRAMRGMIRSPVASEVPGIGLSFLV